MPSMFVEETKMYYLLRITSTEVPFILALTMRLIVNMQPMINVKIARSRTVDASDCLKS